jgi:hypothetical protein
LASSLPCFALWPDVGKFGCQTPTQNVEGFSGEKSAFSFGLSATVNSDLYWERVGHRRSPDCLSNIFASHFLSVLVLLI